MKILLVETQITGHHSVYLQGLLTALNDKDDYHIVLPEKITLDSVDDEKISIIPFEEGGKRKYSHWIGELKKIAVAIRPDWIHFVYADDLYRYFGMGLNSIKQIAPLIATCHQVRRSKLRDCSLKCISSKCRKVIVHTRQLYEDFLTLGIKNVDHIEYPQFSKAEQLNKEEVLGALGITKPEGKILLALGGTREDKGLDILLEALKNVDQSFHLIVAGKEESFKREYIESHVTQYRNNVTLFLEFISDEKMLWCLNAADIIVLPYRKSFDGASGPLGEGVWLRKEIIGPAHGSLKRLIEDNHLGRTFISENVDDLVKTIQSAIEEDWCCDTQYEAYRKELDPLRFAEKHRALYRGE